MPLDLSQDYRIFDNLEAGTLTSKRTSGDVMFPVEQALRRALTKKELADSYGRYTGLDVVWHLPKDLIPAVDPKPGDIWTDDETETDWTILEAKFNTLKSMWRCVSRDPVIVFDLRQLLDVYEPTAALGVTGVREPVYAASYTAIAGRIQEADGSQVEDRGKRGTLKRFNIFVADQLTLTTDSQIRHNGTIYSVKGWRGRESIGQLMTITAETQFGGK